MPTEQQQWLDKYNTYFAATEYNRQHYGKRIKQLKKMLRVLQSENFIKNSSVRPQAKRYVEMYVWYYQLPDEELPF